MMQSASQVSGRHLGSGIASPRPYHDLPPRPDFNFDDGRAAEADDMYNDPKFHLDYSEPNNDTAMAGTNAPDVGSGTGHSEATTSGPGSAPPLAHIQTRNTSDQDTSYEQNRVAEDELDIQNPDGTFLYDKAADGARLTSELPTPKYFLRRKGNLYTPLIALDELPLPVRLSGFSRTMSLEDTKNFKDVVHLDKPSPRSKHVYEITASDSPSAQAEATYTGRDHNPGADFNFDGANAEHFNGQFVGQDNAKFVPDPATMAQRILAKRRTGYLQTLQNQWVRQGRIPPQDPSSFGAFPNARNESGQVYTPLNKGIFGCKIFCSHWLRTGECDFTQQGCNYLHEMPDLLTMENLGMKAYPRWFRELPREQMIALCPNFNLAGLHERVGEPHQFREYQREAARETRDIRNQDSARGPAARHLEEARRNRPARRNDPRPPRRGNMGPPQQRPGQNRAAQPQSHQDGNIHGTKRPYQPGPPGGNSVYQHSGQTPVTAAAQVQSPLISFASGSRSGSPAPFSLPGRRGSNATMISNPMDNDQGSLANWTPLPDDTYRVGFKRASDALATDAVTLTDAELDNPKRARFSVSGPSLSPGPIIPVIAQPLSHDRRYPALPPSLNSLAHMHAVDKDAKGNGAAAREAAEASPLPEGDDIDFDVASTYSGEHR